MAAPNPAHIAHPTQHAVRVLPPEQRPPQVTVDLAAQVASVRDAQAQGHLERLSVNGRPTPWNQAAYLRDPTPYLNVIEPCRIWQSATPSHDTEPLTTPDGYDHVIVEVQPGAQRPLQVQTWPGYPASFTSMDRGAFQNGLTSITVQADAQGIATARFTATPGTTDAVRVSAASPVTSGQVEFHVTIPTPR